MATYKFDGEQALVFPTLGVTVEPGDVFDGPDGLPFALADKKAKKAVEPADASDPIITPTSTIEAAVEATEAAEPITESII